jgi:hypothetical protein
VPVYLPEISKSASLRIRLFVAMLSKLQAFLPAWGFEALSSCEMRVDDAVKENVPKVLILLNESAPPESVVKALSRNAKVQERPTAVTRHYAIRVAQVELTFLLRGKVAICTFDGFAVEVANQGVREGMCWASRS